jgi:hypothetical protein
MGSTDITGTGNLTIPPLVMKAEGAVVFVTPTGYRFFAGQFLRAATGLADPGANAVAIVGAPVGMPDSDRDRSPVKYFLLCKSVELSLKAYLLAKKIPAKLLGSKTQGYGHDIIRLLTEAETHSLSDTVSLSASEKQAVIEAEPYYTERVFDYFNVKEALAGYPRGPVLADLQAAAERLYEGVRQACEDAA